MGAIRQYIETVATVTGQGAASCYTCGYGETCAVGVPALIHGAGVKITPDMIPDVSKQADVIQEAVDAGTLLGKRLSEGHDRREVTMRMQQKMMSALKESA